MLLGCIADDFTGATDLALMLTREGLRTLLTTGLPPASFAPDSADAVVIALKSRSIAAPDAVAQSLAALERLRDFGARRFFFKYCSTFDSTDEGNIGPVAEALLQRLGSDFTIACPAFPAAGRSIYMGNLFVSGVPLAQSPMRDHPLNPMRDSDLCRVLRRQTGHDVGLVSYPDVEAGVAAIRAAFTRERGAKHSLAIVDALDDRHLRDIGAAAVDLDLVTGGSGIAIGLPAAYLAAGLIENLTPAPKVISAPAGRGAVLAGSCSIATRGQVTAAIAAGVPALRIDPLAIAAGSVTAESVIEWLCAQHGQSMPVVYSSDEPAKVAEVQEKLGRELAGRAVETLFADVARQLPSRGFTRLLVAGGETAGAVVGALGVSVLEIGPEIDPGVPWTLSRTEPQLALALKSGNFGAQDFFTRAWSYIK